MRLLLRRRKKRVQLVKQLRDATGGGEKEKEEMEEGKEATEHVEIQNGGHGVVDRSGVVLHGEQVQDKGAGNNLLHNLLKLIGNLETVSRDTPSLYRLDKLEKRDALKIADLLPVSQRGNGVGKFVCQGEMKEMTLVGLGDGDLGNIHKKPLLLGLLNQLLVRLENEIHQDGLDLRMTHLALHKAVPGMDLSETLGHHPLPAPSLHPLRLHRKERAAALVVIVEAVARDEIIPGFRLDDHDLLQLLHQGEMVLDGRLLDRALAGKASGELENGGEHIAVVVCQATRIKLVRLFPGLILMLLQRKINFELSSHFSVEESYSVSHRQHSKTIG